MSVNFYNITVQYIKMLYIYTTITQRNVYILTITLFYTISAVYSKWLTCFHAVLHWFDSLMTVPCGPKHVAVLVLIV